MIVSILLLNYNGKLFNKDCIYSILKQSYKDFEIIFIDNNSSDGSLEEVEEIFSKEIELGIIKIVKNSENLRFAGGNNSGMSFVSKESEYVRLLNNDTVLDRNCLEELIKGIEGNNKLGAVSSIILDRGCEELINKKAEKGEVRIMNIFGVQIREKCKIEKDVFYTNFLCGCSFLYRRSLIDKPFFDFYRLYCEDTQLSWEIILKGYELGICKKSIVHHYGSATTNKIPYTKLLLSTRNAYINFLIFLSKKMRAKLFLPFLTFHILYLLFNYKIIGTLLKVDFNSIKWIGNNRDEIKKARNRINQGKSISENEFMESMSYKIVDSGLYSGKVLVRLIDALNSLTKFHYIIFHIPYRAVTTKNNLK